MYNYYCLKKSSIFFVAFLAICFYLSSCKNDDDNKKQYSQNVAEAVNLGLSVKWASHNVGAKTPEQYGNYYAWGEVEPKDSYTEENSQTYGVYVGTDIKRTKYDVAYVKWGEEWHMPTEAEIKELKENCQWTWTNSKGVNGYLVTGNNGNSIFLPAGGFKNKEETTGVGDCGGYWSSTALYTGDKTGYSLCIQSGGWWHYYYRDIGFMVRPVSD